MERTKKQDGVIRWRKDGGGSLRIKKRIIKPGQIFWAHPDEIPEGFRDVCIPLDDIPQKKTEPIVARTPQYTYTKRDTSNYYDVFDSQGKKVNERALTKAKAIELIESLE